MFTNKTFLITGASSGLGRALAITLAENHAHLALMARNTKNLEETASLCKGNPLLITGDVTSESHCKTAIDEAIRHYGQLNHLVLNAGISMWSRFDTLTDLSAISQLMQTNYLGAINCTYYALPHLKKTSGMITVISSIQGKIGVPYHTGYAASKHALEGFFNSLRVELNKQVNILMVSPGWIKDTDLKHRALGRQFEVRTTSTQKQQAITLETCTNEIIAAMHHRKHELILPKKYYWLSWLKLLAPSLLEELLRNKVKDEEKGVK